MRGKALSLVFGAVISSVSLPSFAVPVLLDFDSLSDGELLTTQYPDTTFSNATVLTAGVSLNEFEFPPASGSNVIFDDGGPLSISFGQMIASFSGLFTYLVPLTLTAVDLDGNTVTSATSAHLNNLALSGDVGSTPNELLALNFAGGFSLVTITGMATGGSFTLDDLTFDLARPTQTVPEPATISLWLMGSFMLVALRPKRRVAARRRALAGISGGLSSIESR